MKSTSIKKWWNKKSTEAEVKDPSPVEKTSAVASGSSRVTSLMLFMLIAPLNSDFSLRLSTDWSVLKVSRLWCPVLILALPLDAEEIERLPPLPLHWLVVVNISLFLQRLMTSRILSALVASFLSHLSYMANLNCTVNSDKKIYISVQRKWWYNPVEQYSI